MTVPLSDNDLENAVKLAQRVVEIQSLTPSGYHWRVYVDRTFGFYSLHIELRNNSWWKRFNGDTWNKVYNINPDDDPDSFGWWVTGGALTVLENRKAKLGYHGVDWDKLAKALEDKLNGRS